MIFVILLFFIAQSTCLITASFYMTRENNVRATVCLHTFALQFTVIQSFYCEYSILVIECKIRRDFYAIVPISDDSLIARLWRVSIAAVKDTGLATVVE